MQVGLELWFSWQQMAPRKPCQQSSPCIYDWIFFVLAGNDNNHNTQISSNFDQIPLLITELAVLDSLKN